MRRATRAANTLHERPWAAQHLRQHAARAAGPYRLHRLGRGPGQHSVQLGSGLGYLKPNLCTKSGKRSTWHSMSRAPAAATASTASGAAATSAAAPGASSSGQN